MKFSFLYVDQKNVVREVKLNTVSRSIAYCYVTSLKDYKRMHSVTKLPDRTLQKCVYVGCKDDNLNFFRG